MATWLFPSMPFKLPKSLSRNSRRRLDSLADSHGDGNSSQSSGSDSGSQRDWQLQRVFQQFDINGDGKVSAEEVRSVLLAVCGEEVSREAIEGVTGEVEMGYEDFVRLMEEGRGENDEGEVERELRLAFEVLVGEDKEGAGGITVDGLRRVLEGLGEARTREECWRMIRAYDVDGNGVIDYEEFHRMMTAACA